MSAVLQTTYDVFAFTLLISSVDEFSIKMGKIYIRLFDSAGYPGKVCVTSFLIHCALTLTVT